jgi:hypothetical protein
VRRKYEINNVISGAYRATDAGQNIVDDRNASVVHRPVKQSGYRS